MIIRFKRTGVYIEENICVCFRRVGDFNFGRVCCAACYYLSGITVYTRRDRTREIGKHHMDIKILRRCQPHDAGNTNREGYQSKF